MRIWAAVFAYFHINSEFSLSSQRQLSGNIIVHICGLGAKVGCEHLSEHSTFSDESHKYGLFIFQVGCALDGDEVIYLIGEELGRGNSCIFQ